MPRTADFFLGDESVGLDHMGEALANARLRGSLLDGRWTGVNSKAAAYAVQEAAAAATDDVQVGYTTLQLREQRNEHRHDCSVYGPLMADRLVSDEGALQLPRGMLGVQFALLFTIGRPYPQDEEVCRSTIATAVVACELGLAFLGRRLPGSVPLNAVNAIADFALHVAHVRGPKVGDWASAARANAIVHLAIDGHILNRITFATLFDRGMKGLGELAEALVARESQLNAGDRAAVGARLPALQVLPGQTVSASVPTYKPFSIHLR